MAIRIIVDGYNFIGRDKGLRGDIEGKREQLIGRLSGYYARKGHPVTVVFDGGRSGWPDEHGEVRGGIEVVFSRHGESADEVIIRMARDEGEGCLVVSSDQEVARRVRAAGAVSVGIGEFEERLFEAEKTDPGAEPEDEPAKPGVKKGNPRRLSKRERKKRLRLKKL